MTIIAIPLINGEINGDPIVIKNWDEIKDYINGKKGEYIVYKVNYFMDTIQEILGDKENEET